MRLCYLCGFVDFLNRQSVWLLFLPANSLVKHRGRYDCHPEIPFNICDCIHHRNSCFWLCKNKQWHLKMDTGSVHCPNGRVWWRKKTPWFFLCDRLIPVFVIGSVQIDEIGQSMDYFKESDHDQSLSSIHNFIIEFSIFSLHAFIHIPTVYLAIKESAENESMLWFSLESSCFVWDCACASLFLLLPVLLDRLVHIA